MCIKIRANRPDNLGLPLGDIKVYTAQGTYSHVEHLNPMVTIDEVKDKFIECCQFANISDPQLLWETFYHHLDYDFVDELRDE